MRPPGAPTTKRDRCAAGERPGRVARHQGMGGKECRDEVESQSFAAAARISLRACRRDNSNSACGYLARRAVRRRRRDSRPRARPSVGQSACTRRVWRRARHRQRTLASSARSRRRVEHDRDHGVRSRVLRGGGRRHLRALILRIPRSFLGRIVSSMFIVVNSRCAHQWAGWSGARPVDPGRQGRTYSRHDAIARV